MSRSPFASGRWTDLPANVNCQTAPSRRNTFSWPAGMGVDPDGDLRTAPSAARSARRRRPGPGSDTFVLFQRGVEMARGGGGLTHRERERAEVVVHRTLIRGAPADHRSGAGVGQHRLIHGAALLGRADLADQPPLEDQHLEVVGGRKAGQRSA